MWQIFDMIKEETLHEVHNMTQQQRNLEIRIEILPINISMLNAGDIDLSPHKGCIGLSYEPASGMKEAFKQRTSCFDYQFALVHVLVQIMFSYM